MAGDRSLWTGTGLFTRATFLVPPVSGVPTDPTTVTLKYKSGTDDPVTLVYGAQGSPIIREGTGVYSAVVPTTQPDATVVEWIGTGTAAVIGVEQQMTEAPPL